MEAIELFAFAISVGEGTLLAYGVRDSDEINVALDAAGHEYPGLGTVIVGPADETGQ